jgi:hypothetical protein
VRLRLFALLVPLAAAAPLLSACDDNNFLVEVILSTDTVTVGLPGSGLRSALDLARTTLGASLLRAPETLADAQEWDVALRRADGVFSLRPNTLTGSNFRGAGISVSEKPFDTVDKAPRGNSAYSSEPRVLTVGSTYLVRSRQFAAGLSVCQKYAAVKVLALDQAAGTAQLALRINENCDDERLTGD